MLVVISVAKMLLPATSVHFCACCAVSVRSILWVYCEDECDNGSVLHQVPSSRAKISSACALPIGPRSWISYEEQCSFTGGQFQIILFHFDVWHRMCAVLIMKARCCICRSRICRWQRPGIRFFGFVLVLGMAALLLVTSRATISKFEPCDVCHVSRFPDVPVLMPSTAIALTVQSSLLDAELLAMRFLSLSLVLMLDVSGALPFGACDSGDDFWSEFALMLGMAGALPGRAGPSMRSFG